MNRRQLPLLILLFALSAYADDDCALHQQTMSDARNGAAQAQARLGKAYFFGTCVEFDTDEAMYWYFRAAEAGSDDAVYAIGSAFSSGIGLDKNERLARHFFERAANKGHEAAIANQVNILATEQYSQCTSFEKIDDLINRVTSPGVRVMIDDSRLNQVRTFCKEHESKIRSPNDR